MRRPSIRDCKPHVRFLPYMECGRWEVQTHNYEWWGDTLREAMDVVRLWWVPSEEKE